MSCCGEKRAQFRHRTGLPLVAGADDGGWRDGQVESGAALPVLFEYTGGTALTAVGPVTRRRYRFPHSGAQVSVDRRDAPAMAGVPNLRRVG